MLTPRAGNASHAVASGLVMFGLYVLVHRIRSRPVDLDEARLYAIGAAASMYFLGI